MAILRSLITRTPLNVWDSFNPRELAYRGPGLPPADVSLFGNRNVGDAIRSNLLIGGQVNGSEVWAIANWYARTNIETLPDEFHGFAASAVVSLWVGNMPRHAIPLSDLLQRNEGQIGPRMTLELCDELARQLWIDSGESVAPRDDTSAWARLDDETRARWNRIARAANDMVSPPLMAIIPERQTYKVTISADGRALGRLLEVLPTSTAPEALVWVHLEGVRKSA